MKHSTSSKNSSQHNMFSNTKILRSTALKKEAGIDIMSEKSVVASPNRSHQQIQMVIPTTPSAKGSANSGNNP